MISKAYLDLLRGVQWRSLSSVWASIGDPLEGAGRDSEIFLEVEFTTCFAEEHLKKTLI